MEETTSPEAGIPADKELIRMQQDFFLSRLLQQHGVNFNDSICMAKDSNVIAQFLENAAKMQDFEQLDIDDEFVNIVDPELPVLPVMSKVQSVQS